MIKKYETVNKLKTKPTSKQS